MDLAIAKQKLVETESVLAVGQTAPFAVFETPHGEMQVTVTDRLRKKCKKGKVWKSPAMLTALKNAEYGFDPKASRSHFGSDGVFYVDRGYTPPNSMMQKLFGRFLDKPDPLVPSLVELFKRPVEEWIAVRLVSHHMRLLGFLVSEKIGTHLVLVDYDNEKAG